MKWSNLSKLVGKYAPMIGTLLGGPAGAAIGSVVSATLGVENDPKAVEKVLLKKGDEAGNALKLLQEKNRSHYESMLLEVQKLEIVTQAKTYESELKTGSRYVMWWRPTFGYFLALSFLIWSSAFSYLLINIIDKPSDMSVVITSVSQLMGPVSIIWGMALAVLGVNVHSRSKDKQVEKTGQPSKGLLDRLFSK